MKVYRKSKNTAKPAIINMTEHWTNGVSRRQFVKSTLVVSLLASISACKPKQEASIDQNLGKENQQPQSLINQSSETVQLGEYVFSDKQHGDLQAVYMHLFPDDGDGPSANDLNVITYLEWAMTDKNNVSDGDPEFIIKGLGWLNQYANDAHGSDFVKLDQTIQNELITNTIKSDEGGRWVSLLIYYLIEALTLDPYYGGNTNQIGWKWLQHQGGFPQPIAGKTYRDFE